MENWSYRFREFWLLNKREIKRYGLCVLLMWAGFTQATPAAVFIGLGIALVLWSFDRWGQPWAERGRKAMEEERLRKSNS